jgi:hypothetical protein
MITASERRRLESQYCASTQSHGAVLRSAAGLLAIVGLATLGLGMQQTTPLASISASQVAHGR